MEILGSTLGPYKILEPLGAGGMGEVYLGEDTRLGRKVAIKVLPEEFAADPERLARFEQEARAAAALNHPHIAVVHDIGFEPGEAGPREEAGAPPLVAAGTSPSAPASPSPSATPRASASPPGVHYIVQEFLDGETLRAPLKKGALPLKKALHLAAEVAEGLAAAHAAGIVHRDLKPENLFVTKDGHAKILDFGLAKLTEAAPVMSPGERASQSPTMLGTVAGQVMGTAGYMAPEQVQGGGEVDHRADLFSFGCVIYEMVGGRQAFAGRSVLQTLDLILNEEPPDLAEMVHDVPAQLQWILTKALAKDPGERYQSAGDLLVDLRRLAKEIESGKVLASATAAGGSLAGAPDADGARAASHIPLKLAVPAGVVLAAVAVLAGWLLARPALGPAPAPQRWDFDLPEGTFLPAGSGADIAVSPDGQTIAYVASGAAGSRRLYLRRLGQMDSIALPGTEDATAPFFSPDGDWVAFNAGGGLKKVALAGGEPFTLCMPCGEGSWADDGTIILAQDGALWRVPEVGGEPQLLVEPSLDGERLDARRPTALPGSQAVLFQRGSTFPSTGVCIVSLETQEVIEVSGDGADPRWADTGHVLFPRGNTLFAVGFDLERFEVTSPPVPVLQNVRVEAGGALQAAVSRHGLLVYAPADALSGGALVWVDRAGNGELAMQERRVFGAARVSPDGTRIAVDVRDTSGLDIWVYDIAPSTFRRLTTTANARYPVWTPDGAGVTFTEGSNTLRWLPADGSGPAETLLVNETSNIYAESWGPAGDRLVFRRIRPTNDLMVLEVGGGEPWEFLATEFAENAASLSHDGRWLAYQSNRSGTTEVYVRPFPGPGGETLVSIGGGGEPVWAPDDREIFYRGPSRLVAVSVETEPEFRILGREELFDATGYSPSRTRAYYDVHPDGRFLIIRQEVTGDRPKINVVVNWFEELRDAAPPRR